ncbi:hypothetical protein [Metabacillus rhizolycopersici]|uniref:MerR family transcriptional regulator n=1 Tax=Metabacillus rhizolycopersici TaxID=2875709 RepID=A0ABS7UYX3_9BACI|nr:hypothetical protein [Metabacillus rhizolycopersici]MBZ5753525.1 hypothetical protein [Metabacillus rhizolycopersici]
MNEPVNTTYWQITEFAEKVTENIDGSVHYNTVAKWFNKLETMGVHYVSRAAGEKIYDELDLEIGVFIHQKRAEKWRLDVIFENLPKYTETRPFPDEWEGESSPTLNYSEIEEAIIRKMSAKMQDQLIAAQKEIANTIEQVAMSKISSLLPQPKTEDEIRTERLNHALLQMKLNNKLEEAALDQWNKQPDHIRVRKVGFFRKEENYEEKDRFIRNYKNQNMERVLREELDIE